MSERKYTEEQRIAQRERVRVWAKANPDRARANKKRYVEKNLDRLKQERRVHYLANNEKIRARSAERVNRLKAADPESFGWACFFQQQKRAYGLTRETWTAMFEAQGRRCGCCEAEAPGGRNRWHTDHCHATGKVRGILCYGCNIMLGGARDQERVLSAGAAYLERTR